MPVAIGFAGLTKVDSEVVEAKNQWELSYWFGAAFWGRGYASEAASALVRYGFRGLHAEKIVAWHGTDNPASRRVQEKLGFVFQNQQGMVFSLGRGKLVPCRLMGISCENTQTDDIPTVC